MITLANAPTIIILIVIVPFAIAIYKTYFSS